MPEHRRLRSQKPAGMLLTLFFAFMLGPGNVLVAEVSTSPGTPALNSAASASPFTPRLPERLCPGAEARIDESGPFKGRRRLALVVGVGHYLSPRVPSLDGPALDAEKVYDFLLNPSTGLGFYPENVCLLKDEAATREAFLQAFAQCLTGRARDGDLVVVYFAGHGSQVIDGSGDEPDGLDETLMLADARTDQGLELVDDELNGLLGSLLTRMGGPERPQQVVVLLDACNSGTATRKAEGLLRNRFFDAGAEPLDLRLPHAAQAGSASGNRWEGAALPGVVVLAGAIDGTPANETNGEGLFTKALLQTLKEASGSGLTYQQLALRIRQRIPALSAGVVQKVEAQGGKAVDGPAFGGLRVGRPPSLEVASVSGNRVRLQGPPLPGWGPGAEVRIHAWPPRPGASTQAPADLQDPAKAHALLTLQTVTALDSWAEIQANSAPILPGELAVLSRPSLEAQPLKVLIDPAESPGGVPEPRRQTLLAALHSNPIWEQSLEVVSKDTSAPLWHVRMNSRGQLQLFDPADILRCTSYATPDLEATTLLTNLSQLARQQALLKLVGEPGRDFINDQTLDVWVEERPPLPDIGDASQYCPHQNTGTWPSEVNRRGARSVDLPYCHSWGLVVRLSDDPTLNPTHASLYVGGLLLSSDGGIVGFPGGEGLDEPDFVLLKPGQTYTFKQPLLAMPPLNAIDQILIFGMREDNRIAFSRLAEPSATRGVGVGRSTRPATWTSTSLMTRTIANSLPPLPEAAALSNPAVASFDLRPVMPGNPNSALHRLLKSVHTTMESTRASDTALNPSTLVSMSPAINPSTASSRRASEAASENAQGLTLLLETFRRAGLLAAQGDWSSAFQSCRAESVLLPGDLLIYRAAQEPTWNGQALLMIDPERGVVWGQPGLTPATADPSVGSQPPEKTIQSGYFRLTSIAAGLHGGAHGEKASPPLAECWRLRQAASEWSLGPEYRPGSFDLREALTP